MWPTCYITNLKREIVVLQPLLAKGSNELSECYAKKKLGKGPTVARIGWIKGGGGMLNSKKPGKTDDAYSGRRKYWDIHPLKIEGGGGNAMTLHKVETESCAMLSLKPSRSRINSKKENGPSLDPA